MFKAPARSKRRLAASLGSLATVAAARLLACALEDMAQWPGPTCYAPAHPADAAWLTSELGLQPLVALQRGLNLGARINYVNRTLFEAGHERQLFIGIDCPALDRAYLVTAALRLATVDAVIGPAHDGGAVTIGTRRVLPDLTDLPWSTTELQYALEEALRAAKLGIATLTPRTDIDTIADLRAAAEGLESDERAARRALRAWVLDSAPALGKR
jgi:uncharacterized protein